MNALLSRREGLVLVGYRGTGKSTVGRLLAERSGRPFVDADYEIEARAGRSIRAIFEESGEPAFRDWEERVLREVAEARPGAVLATGGGAILREANRRVLRSFGRVVWLRAEPHILVRRLEADARTRSTRPALTSGGVLDEIADVLAARTPLYEEVAHASVETEGKPAHEIADWILEDWSRCSEPRPPQEPHPCS
ncbi:shikimate kinase [Paludisphaera borealis]|uniref:Shikimate kinase n=1 Tax=Paludisphaera borealis TaxID=1387353 RepID=A0A1U7CWK8_9BACT|nr:shikimate kinase [Paludisphaera borealis]APW63332.1 Shikimate kinase 1 [Paludisphaera borealis]